MTNFNYNLIKKKKIKYIIAEIGVNHECSILKAKKMIYLAKKNGALAVKFQSYKAETLASKNSKAYWDIKKEKTSSQYNLFKKYEKFNYKEYKKLATYCKKIKIDFLSTPFDLNSVDYLDKLVKVYKVSSSDITNVPLLRKISSKGKPVLLSTGASKISEIKDAIKNLRYFKKIKIIIMHCILNYPTKNEDANLLMIKHLQKSFKNFVIGYSDHTLPSNDMLNISIAYSLGANVIEKHFTLNKQMPGNDHYHSMDCNDLKTLSNNLKKIDVIMGKSNVKTYLNSEKISRLNARRSIFLSKDVKKGQILNYDNLITLRPNTGISAKMWDKVLNKKAAINLKNGKKLSWNEIK